ncbi:MAG TPA: hypothetical protein VG869_00085 [Acidimicrobiia bacterium]|jgi:hypothetical protein|nr:hypothetical protein [Acidimicrobiia bacterium]
MAEPRGRAAFYAARPGGWRDWWTLLHPPYTAWHLGYVAIGAALAPRLDGVRLGATVLAFFAAMGVGAHALDELHGHPLRTQIPDRVLVASSVVGVLAAVGIGVAGISRAGPVLIPFIVVGPVLVVAYNLELFGGRLHTDAGFALSWGAFPVLTAYAAQADGLGVAAVIGAAAAFTLSYAQRALSTPARLLRRRVRRAEGDLTLSDGRVLPLDAATLLRPLERSLRALSSTVVLLAAAMVTARLW